MTCSRCRSQPRFRNFRWCAECIQILHRAVNGQDWSDLPDPLKQQAA